VTTLSTVPEAASRSPKGEQTRQAIVAAALDLFRAGGYDRTTMRAIADAAGVSLGNAYYYFGSKEHLVQAFYERIQVDHAAASRELLDTSRSFGEWLLGVLDAWVDVAAPYHAFAGKFFKVAAEPTSPLSPFSEESADARETSVALFREVVEGAELKVPAAIRAELPELLWLLQMGVVLFWVHDPSDGQQRTHRLVRQVVPLVDKLVRMTRLPGMKGVVGDVVDLVRSVRA